MAGKGKKKGIGKIISIIVTVLMYVFFAICLLGLVVSIMSKRSGDGAVSLFGYEMRFVLTGSMEADPSTDVSAYKIKSIKKNSVIFVKRVPEDKTKAEAFYADIKIGDVLTFRYVYGTRQETITHRVVCITAKESGGYIILLRGDNKDGNDEILTQEIDTSAEESFNYVIGKVVGSSYVFGLIIYILKQPIGIILTIIVPSAIIIIFEVIRITSAVGAAKRKKELEERERNQNAIDEQLSEIEELKRKLAALENARGGDVGSSENADDGNSVPDDTEEGSVEDINEQEPQKTEENVAEDGVDIKTDI